MTKNNRFQVIPNFFRHLITSASKCPDGVEYRTLMEVILNLKAGTFTFSPEVSDYILFEYEEEGLEQCLRLRCSEQEERSRLREWLRACNELEWNGFGSEIDYEALPELAHAEW